MVPLKKMLVAYDGSPGSQKALKWAVRIAREHHSQMVLVAVADETFPECPQMDTDIITKALDVQRHQLTEMLQKAEYTCKQQGLSVTAVLRTGTPCDELIECAEEQYADIIVTGTRGCGISGSLMLGSVAHKLVTYSPISVAVIK